MSRKPKPTFPRLTPRTLDLLRSLDIVPCTRLQLRQLSQTFSQPFASESRIKQKLSELKQAGWVQSFPYAIPTDGRPPHYWKLTRTGYRLAFPGRSLPRRRYFDSIGTALHQHTKALADVLTHIMADAASEGLSILDYHRENDWRLQAGHDYLYPDAAFRIRIGDRSPLFCIEIDNGTERIQTAKDIESIERKIRIYDLYQSDMQAFDANRPIVLFVTTRSERRLEHILETAHKVVGNPERSLVYGTTTATLLSNDQPLTDRVFLDHRLRRQSMIREQAKLKLKRQFPLRTRWLTC